MNAFWTYFWPAFAAGAVVGLILGLFAFRRGKRRRNLALAAGALLSIGLAALWHGPLGGADRFSSEVERGIQRTFVYYEILQVRGQLHHGPLTRHVQLSGPADDYQRAELVRLIEQVPGVSSASWSGGTGVPLIVEAALVSLAGFLLGLLLAYLIELRRRYNAQWNW